MRHKTADTDVDRILGRSRVDLASWPTPVEEVEPGLWVKRDDLSGWGRGGAKARKIEHVLGYLSERSRTELITVAGNVTNLAFDLLPALDLVGIHSTLFIADDPPAAMAAREEIFHGILDRVTLIGPTRVEAILRAVAAYVRGRAQGRRPFLLLPGGSHPSALVGNACGFIEMVRQFEERGVEPPRTVFITAATGNTIGGFLIGEHALRRVGRRPIRIVGVQVYPGWVRFWTRLMIRWTERFAELRGRVPTARIEIDASALHGGFGNFTDDLAETCDRLSETARLDIDPIFGGKTWNVLERYRAEGRVEGPVLYWHCGYTPEWRDLATRLLPRRGAA